LEGNRIAVHDAETLLDKVVIELRTSPQPAGAAPFSF